MTEWIDHLVANLSDDQKQKNLRRAVQLLHAELIKGRGPAFFDDFAKTMEALSKELDEKVGATIGAVSFKSFGDRLLVGSSGPKSVKVSAQLDLSGQQITIIEERTGPDIVAGNGTKRHYLFKVDDAGELSVESQGEVFHDGKALASHVLTASFTHYLFP